jgi:hypothetical protein
MKQSLVSVSDLSFSVSATSPQAILQSQHFSQSVLEIHQHQNTKQKKDANNSTNTKLKVKTTQAVKLVSFRFTSIKNNQHPTEKCSCHPDSFPLKTLFTSTFMIRIN